MVFGSFSVFLGGCIYTIFSTQKAKTLAGYLFAFICAVILLLLILRIVSALDLAGVNKLYEFSISNLISALTGFIIPYGSTLSFLLLCNERKMFEVEALQKVASKEAELKNRLLATLSHELRTPLNGMIGTAQLLKSNNNAELNVGLDTIINAGKSLTEVSQQVLDYAAQSAKEPVANGSTNINVREFFTGLISTVNPLAVEKSLMLKVNVSEQVPTYLFLDTLKMQRILLNLLSNGLKYTDEGYVALNIDVDTNAENEQAKEVTLNISVADTGIGIPLLEQQTLLEPFQRGSNVIDKREGSGLGLSLVDGELNALGTKLTFTSIENKGSKFNFILTVEVGSDIPTLNEVSTTLNQSLNILLVEDIPLNIDVVSKMLRRKNHEVNVAKRIDAAKRLLEHQAFDLVLLDMQLPDGHGLELLDIMKKTQHNHHTPVIALTAALTSADRVKYKESTLKAVVEKPIIEIDLNKAIANILSNQKCSDEIKTDMPNESHDSGGLLFDKKPLSFLIENLSKQDLMKAIDEMPNNIKQYIEDIKSYGEDNNTNKQKYTLHQLASYSGQFGLTALAKMSSGFENNLSNNQLNNVNELDKLFIKSVIEFNAHVSRIL
jgi:signal transduction histidine kinase/DNA-binding NarL/FixJ family response regulator